MSHLEPTDLDKSLLCEPLVDLWPVGDIPGTMGVVEGAQGLLQVAVGGRDCGNDGRLCTTSQRVLQDPGKLALPMWSVCDA